MIWPNYYESTTQVVLVIIHGIINGVYIIGVDITSDVFLVFNMVHYHLWISVNVINNK